MRKGGPYLYGIVSWANEALTECCFNVGPPSSTSAQHENNIGPTPRFAGKLISPRYYYYH